MTSPSYACRTCSATAVVWTRCCSMCGNPGLRPVTVPRRKVVPRKHAPVVDPFSYAAAPKTKRIHVPTGFGNIDAMFGGGLPRPAVIILGGGQGGGKSTLCLQIAAHLGAHDVLYIAGEEPRGDVKLRGDTFGLADKLQRLKIYCCIEHDARNMAVLRPALEAENRRVIIMDSLHCLRDTELDTKDKQQNMLRNINYFFDLSRARQCTIILIARLNTNDEFAGIREVEFVADASMRIRKGEGSEPKSLRVLYFPQKNRFAPDQNEARFIMTGTGLHEVSDAQVGEMVERAVRKRRGKDED